MTRIEATIAELAAGGDGVAVSEAGGERRAIFVPGVAPGDKVALEVDLAGRPPRGRVLAMLEPSADRVTPACADAARCGACDWMHVSAGAQAREHAGIVARALPRAWAGAGVRARPAARELGYRTRTRVHVEAGRSGKIAVGMFGRRTREPVRVDACVVLDPRVEQARRALPELLSGARGRGEALLSLGRPAPGGERSAVLELRWSGDLPASVFAKLEARVAEGSLAGARVFAGAVKVPATVGDPRPFLEGPDGEPLELAPGGFAQASEAGNAALAGRVAELARELVPDPEAAALELYAGAGNLSVLLARQSKLVAVEADRAACAAARANLSARGLSARVVEADAATHAIGRAVRLVVLDPPRAGAREVARVLASRPSPAVVYVSCDPATLGRDLAILAEAGYTPHAIETFEMFPQTSHVETVVAMRSPRRAAPSRGGTP